MSHMSFCVYNHHGKNKELPFGRFLWLNSQIGDSDKGYGKHGRHLNQFWWSWMHVASNSNGPNLSTLESGGLSISQNNYSCLVRNDGIDPKASLFITTEYQPNKLDSSALHVPAHII